VKENCANPAGLYQVVFINRKAIIPQPENKKMATVENCSLADRMDRVYEKD